jgi:hypothetical protein
LRRARKNPDGFIASAACTPVQAMRRIISRCMTSCGASASSRAPLIIRAPLAAKSRLSRSSRLGTHTRSIRAHLRSARSSPPRPLWFCIVDMQSRFSESLPHDTQPLAIGFEAAFLQAPVAERPLVLPPEIREPMSCHCYSNQHRRRALGAAPRRSLPLHSRRANGFSWFDAPRAGISVRTRSIMAPYGSGEPKQHVQGRRIPPVCR